MKTTTLLKTLALGTLAVSGASVLGAAVTIYSDSFDAPTSTNIVGQLPPTIGSGLGLGGNAWLSHGSASYTRNKLNGDLWLGPDTGVVLALGADTDFQMQTELTITAQLNRGNFAKTTDHRVKGMGFGFFTNGNTTSGYGFDNFVGITVSNEGKLLLLKDPNASGGAQPWVLASVDIAGWLPGANHTLSYTIDVATGAITHLTFKVGGNAAVDYTASFTSITGVFTQSHLNYVGLYGNANGGNTAYVKDFTLSGSGIAIPEPSAAAVLLGVGALGLGLTRRRRK